jgi:DNA-directed RNA polymerase subunit E'/Rpb7
MNSDIRNNMKMVLKKKVEKKCNKNGYIDEVYKILEFSDGIMIPENLNGSAIYNIAYHCRLCIPIENSIIIGQVKVINQELIVAINGSIMMFIPRENIDPKYWINNIDNFTHNEKSNVKLNIGDYVCVQIINKRINQYDTQIKTIGKLLDLPTTKQIEKYFGTVIDETGNIVNNQDSNFI